MDKIALRNVLGCVPAGRWPEWLLNYRRPSHNNIKRMRSNTGVTGA